MATKIQISRTVSGTPPTVLDFGEFSLVENTSTGILSLYIGDSTSTPILLFTNGVLRQSLTKKTSKKNVNK